MADPNRRMQNIVNDDLRDIFAAHKLTIPSNLGETRQRDAFMQEMPPPSIGMTPLPGSVMNAHLSEEQMEELVSSELRLKPSALTQPGESTKEVEYGAMTEEEKVAIYKEFLRDIGVSSTWRWEDVTRTMGTSSDKRKKALDTIQRKKQVFQEYLQECKRRDREMKNERKMQHKENFIKLLDEHKSIIRVDSRFSDVVLVVGADPRFKTLDEKERQDLFQEYMEDFEKKDRALHRERSMKNIQKIKALLAAMSLDVTYTWKQASEDLADQQAWSQSDGLDRIQQAEQLMSRAFSGFMRQLESETILREKAERRRQERINRQNFRDLLKELWSEKRLAVKTKWAELVQKIVHEERYVRMVGQAGSTPKELFDDFIEMQKEKIKNQKQVLKSLIKSQGLKMSSSMEFEDFHNQLKGFEEYSSISERETQIFLYEYWMNKLREKQVQSNLREEETKKKYYKAMKRYQDYVHDQLKGKGVCEFKEIEENPLFEMLSSSEKEKIFQEELAHYKKKKEAQQIVQKEAGVEQEDGERSDSEGGGEYLKKAKKHKKKHSKKKSGKKHREDRYDYHEPPATKKYRHDDS